MIAIYQGTLVEKILPSKDEPWSIFDLSPTQAAALAKGIIIQEHWWHDSWHMKKWVQSLAIPKFDLIVTYREDARAPIRIPRTPIHRYQLEVVHNGLKTLRGPYPPKLFQDHPVSKKTPIMKLSK